MKSYLVTFEMHDGVCEYATIRARSLEDAGVVVDRVIRRFTHAMGSPELMQFASTLKGYRVTDLRWTNLQDIL